MPSKSAQGPSSEPPDQAPPRLGYLLKQAHLQFTELASDALAPLGIGTREWAAMIYLEHGRGLSQQEVARGLGVDRTTMVALVDELQQKGLVERGADLEDRRKNRVELTTKGHSVLQRGAQKVDDAERRFLAALSDTDAQSLKRALRTVIALRPSR